MNTPLDAARIARDELVRLRDPRSEDGKGFRYVRDRCESPIETVFALALFQVLIVRGRTLDRLQQVIASTSRSERIYVFPQCPILEYRADFLLISKNVPRPNPPFLLVECDGRDYHSIEKDEPRDRRLIEVGFEVVRFSGSNIYSFPELVVNEVLAHFWLPRVVLPADFDLAIWQLRQTLPPPPPKMPFTDKFLSDVLDAFKRGRSA